MNDEPQFQILIDDEKVQALKLSMSDVDNIMSAAWGSMYVNDFNDRGRVKKSIFRANPAHVYHRRILINGMSRNSDGDMVSFASLQQANGFMAHQNWSNIMVSLLSKSRGTGTRIQFRGCNESN
ncbi:efflux RND transporter permease subunit [Escherichia coli]|nr:efflux RND transporter permease subunit [Escherichia coli]